MTTIQTNKDNEFVISRLINAPRELVWKMWTEPEHLEHWWGPIGMKLTVRKMELRPGGVFHYEMESGTGNKMWGKFVYKEIIPPEKFTCINSFADEDGNVVRAPFPGVMWPMEWLTEYIFEGRTGKTLMSLRSSPLNASTLELETFVGGFKSMEGGFGATFDQLDKYVETVKKGILQ